MNAAVFLDRDNTIIHNDGDLGDPEQVRLIQGAATAIASLCGLGYKVVVVTNQGGVARGKYGEEDVHAVHQRIQELVQQLANGARIDGFYYCPYHPKGTVPEYTQEHHTRKPQPGMLLEAAKDLKLDLSQSWMVGDAIRDIEAGEAAGTRTVLIQPDAARTGAVDAAMDIPDANDVRPDFVAHSIVEAVRIIAQQRKPESAEEARQAEKRRWDPDAVRRLRGERTADASPDDEKQRGEAAEQGGDVSASLKTSSTTPKRPPRPFRPWGAAGDEGGETPSRSAVSTQARPSPTSTPSAATSTNVDTHHAAQYAAKPTAAPAATQPLKAQVAAVSDEDDDADLQTSPAAANKGPAADKTLRLILQELRNQRGTTGEFSYLRVLAIVLQMVAGVCLLGGLWMGANDTDLFLRWMGAGLLLQGATIAVLLFER